MMTSLEESPSSLNSAFKSGKEGGTKWLGIGELRQVFTAVYIAMNGMIREDWDIIGRWLDEIKTSIYCVLTLRKLLCQLKKLGMKWTIPAWGGGLRTMEININLTRLYCSSWLILAEKYISSLRWWYMYRQHLVKSIWPAGCHLKVHSGLHY